MMKFIISIMFLNFMVILGNNMLMFYYNLCYLISLFVILSYSGSYLDWFGLGLVVGGNYYSMMLVTLSVWIVGLMFMSLEEYDKLKLMVFINMLMILVFFFLLNDLFLFYLVFEVSMIPTFFLIIYWGGNYERFNAAYYMVIYMLLISFPLLVYIFNMYFFNMTLKFSLMMMMMGGYKLTFWSFLMIYMAFYIKMPIYLFHVWLPKAHVEAPVYGSMILAGVLLKMGSYGLIRLIEIFYVVSLGYNWIIFGVSVIGGVVVGMLCLVQVDMKSMVAYSSVVHMNLMLCSLMTLMKVGLLGGYLMMVAHGLCSSGMFYMVNMYYKRSGSRLLMLNKGMMSNLPTVIMWWFLFCVVNFSFPLSLNFMGEVMMLMSMVNWDFGVIFYVALICFFSSAYSLYLFSYVSHGKNIYYENKIFSSELKEYLILIMHFFPLLMFLLNLYM